MHFTINQDPFVDGRVERDLAVMAHELELALGTDLVALVLVGGFGRGEGSVILWDAGPQPLNDYDIVVILRSSTVTRNATLRRLGPILARKVGIRSVDLIPLRASALQSLPPTIFNHEMIEGGHVFHGPADILHTAPQISGSDLPAQEALILLLQNRSICLLHSHPGDVRLNLEGDAEHRLFAAMQIAKAILAGVEATLLLKQAYHFSYRERSRRYAALAPSSDFVRAATWATQFKLLPADDIGAAEIQKRWCEARVLYEPTLRAVAAEVLDVDIGDWCDFAETYRSTLHAKTARMWAYLKRVWLVARSPRHLIRTLVDPGLFAPEVNVAQILTLFAVAEDGKRVKKPVYLSEASRLLRVTGACTQDWHHVREVAVRSWYEFVKFNGAKTWQEIEGSRGRFV